MASVQFSRQGETDMKNRTDNRGMFMRRALVLTALLAAAGCGITSRNAQVREWIGRQESDLIAAWGEPARTERDRAGRRVLVYDWVDEQWVDEPGRAWTESDGTVRWTAPTRRLERRREIRRFVVESDGRIVDGSWRFY